VVGLGALNVDLIATAGEADAGPAEDNETTATIEEIRARLRGVAQPVAFAGGSAFNAMVMLAQLDIGLRLGMLGITGEPAAEDRLVGPHAERLAELGIADVTHRSARRPGLCLALSGVHHRRLFTAPEANLEVAAYLRDDAGPRDAVAAARVLHLTSLLEDPLAAGAGEVAARVADFVEAAKAANRALLLSLDPGRTWVDGLARLPELRRIYALADVLFVSTQERDTLRRGRTLQALCSSHTVVVVKSAHEIVVERADGFRVARVPRYEGAATVDATGAGDAVAAGVLAALGDGYNVVEGCRLGLRIAARRVADLGDRGHADLRRSLGVVWPAEWSIAR
jgi:sugar/nucleoside kinase (ribokinase family)